MTDTNKIKVLFNDLQTRLKICENKIDLHSSLIDESKGNIKSLLEKKENHDKLKESHQSFSSSFNTTVKNISTQIDTTQEALNDKMALEASKREELKADLLVLIADLDAKIQVHNKMLDI